VFFWGACFTTDKQHIVCYIHVFCTAVLLWHGCWLDPVDVGFLLLQIRSVLGRIWSRQFCCAGVCHCWRLGVQLLPRWRRIGCRVS